MKKYVIKVNDPVPMTVVVIASDNVFALKLDHFTGSNEFGNLLYGENSEAFRKLRELSKNSGMVILGAGKFDTHIAPVAFCSESGASVFVEKMKEKYPNIDFKITEENVENSVNIAII